MPLASLFRRNPAAEPARQLYAAIVDQARLPAFFSDHGVPDTIDGRFELVALHAFLVLARLKAGRPATEKLSQALFDTMFTELDRGLRESGVGDLSVGKHVKRMAQSFYGRIRAYERGLAEGPAALDEALKRNLYGTAAPAAEHLAALASYMEACVAALAAQPIERLQAGAVRFASVPGGEGGEAGHGRE